MSSPLCDKDGDPGYPDRKEMGFDEAFAEMAKDRKALAEVRDLEGTLADGLEEVSWKSSFARWVLSHTTFPSLRNDAQVARD